MAAAAAAAATPPQQQQQQPENIEVSFINPKSVLRLQGTFVRADAAPNAPCVILCHGYACNRNGMALPALSEALAAAGVNSLRCDFQGNGASEGVMRFGNFYGEVSDIAAAKAFLEAEHKQQVAGLLGHSKGGCVVLLYAAQHADIPRVVNVAGRYVMTEGVKERFGADILERLSVAPVDIVAAAPREPGGPPIRLTLTLEVRARACVLWVGCSAVF
jgi:pimeloyl-ACP methyl ester carboxylesterase